MGRSPKAGSFPRRPSGFGRTVVFEGGAVPARNTGHSRLTFVLVGFPCKGCVAWQNPIFPSQPLTKKEGFNCHKKPGSSKCTKKEKCVLGGGTCYLPCSCSVETRPRRVDLFRSGPASDRNGEPAAVLFRAPAARAPPKPSILCTLLPICSGDSVDLGEHKQISVPSLQCLSTPPSLDTDTKVGCCQK